jgi:DNA-binding transcriptional LysR family regulator
MNVQQLTYLVAVADSGSVSAAGRALHVTQPVISRSIRAFEQEHRVKLFRRSGRRLVPTEAGTAIIASARRALGAIDAVTEMARDAGNHAELSIATTPTNGSLLGRALIELGRSRPDIAVQVCRASDTTEVRQFVEEGRAELGFGDVLPLAAEPEFTVEPVTEVEVVFVSPVGSDLPGAVSWHDIVKQRMVLPPAGSGRRRLIDDTATSTSGKTPRASLITDERTSWVAAAQAGIGSFLSYRPVVDRIDDIEIRPLEPPSAVSIGFVHRTGPISSAATELIALGRSSLPA